MTRAALAVSLFCLACADDHLHPAFTNTWISRGTASIPGSSPVDCDPMLSITVSGSVGAVDVDCLSGGGRFQILGSGNNAAWTEGAVSCEGILDQTQPCRVTLTFRSFSLTLLRENLLSGTATGTATGCNLDGVAYSMTLQAAPKPPPASPP